MNYYAAAALDSGPAFGAALVIGLLFGFWLERAGFGSAKKLAAIFYRDDFAVLKVMFTAIAVGAVGLYGLEQAGVVAPSGLYRPETFWKPQIAGGVLFGVGFVTGGWCPGTALVGFAAGRLDAFVFLLGAALGSLAFAAAYPAVGAFSVAGACGVSTLPELFGLAPGLVVVLVVALALVSFAVARRLTVRPAA
jgi:hypothetical protein